MTTSSDRHQKRTTKTGSPEPDHCRAAKRAHWNVLVKTGIKRWDRTSGQSFLRWTVTRRSLYPSSGTVSNGKRLPLKISWSPPTWARKLSMRLPQDHPYIGDMDLAVSCRCGHPEDILIARRHCSAIAARWHVAKNFATLHECKQKVLKSNEL